MKKSLLVVALLGTFGVATAQTSVTLYGTVDAGVAYNNGTFVDGKRFSLESGQQSYSRVGFRGTEDLGSGMKALFVLEQGVQIDTGDSGYQTIGSGIPLTDPNGNSINTGAFSSQAYVGLSSGFGTLKLGRQFTPLYEAHGEIDPFQNGFAANINNFFGSYGSGSFSAVSPYQRMDNAVIYNTTDSLYGFKGALAYGFGEVPGHSSQQSQVGASLGYANGPVTIAYAYHHANNDAFGFDSFKTHFIGGKFNFGMATIHAAYDVNKVSNLLDTRDYMIGVTVPFGMQHSVFGSYTHKKDKLMDHANSGQFGLGYTYNLSKRTNLYAAYTYVRNDDNAFINVEDNEFGAHVSIVQIGMRHKF